MKGNSNCANCDRLEELISDYKIDIEDLKLDLKLAEEKGSPKLLKEKEELFKREKKVLEKELSELKTLLDKKDCDIKWFEKQIEDNRRASRFIDQILTAKKYSHGSVLDREAEINNLAHLLKEDIYPFLREIAHLDKEYMSLFGEELDIWKRDEKKYWLKDKKTIAFIGQFSAGKTTIVNRILSQDKKNIPQLPESSKAMTAIPTYVCGGTRKSYQFVTSGHEIKEISESTFSMIDKELLGRVKGIGSLIEYLVLSYNNSNLQGLSILDTPGFGSNDEDDAKRTLDVINESDALFWVFDVNNGQVNDESLKLIKSELKKPLFIVINQVDTKHSSEVKAVQDLITQTLRKAGLNIKGIIPFSKKNNLEDIMKPIRTVQNNKVSNYLKRVQGLLNDILNNSIEPSLKTEENRLENLKRMSAHKTIDMYEAEKKINRLLGFRNGMRKLMSKFEHQCKIIKSLE